MKMNLIASARTAFDEGNAALGKERLHLAAWQLLNALHLSQVRRGDLVPCGGGRWETRPLRQKHRLKRIMEHELFYDPFGRPLPENVPPSNCPGIIAELEVCSEGVSDGGS